MEKSKGKIISFDMLRIFACLSILMVHVAIFLPIQGKIGRILETGSSGLNIFFVLSGFLNFASLDTSTNLKKWYVKRLVRIIPIYYAILVADIIVFECILGCVPKDPNGLGWLGYFLCLNKIVPPTELFWVSIGAVGSISIFVWFYLLAPLFHKFINKFERAVLFFVISYIAARVILSVTQWGSAFTNFYYFGVGIVAYYAVKESKSRCTNIVGLIAIGAMILLKTQGGLIYSFVIGLLMINSHDFSCKYEKINFCTTLFSKITFCIYLAHGFVIEVLNRVYEGNMIGKVLYFSLGTVFITLFLYCCVEQSVVKLVFQKNKSTIC